MSSHSDSDNHSVHSGNAATSLPSPRPIDYTKNAPILPSPPFVAVEGVPNFRDLGGYACPAPPDADASTPYHVRTGVLYRCATLAQITVPGRDTLTEALGLKALYDLRSAPETKRVGAIPEIPGLSRHFTPVYEEEDYSPAVLAKKYRWYTAADADPAHGYSEGFINAYRDIATFGARGGAYRRILEHLRDRPTEPLVFHCSAGKDRTGCLAAVLLKLCGVDEDVISWEYSITEPGLGQWREDIIAQMMRSGMSGNPPNALPGDRAGAGMPREEAERICGSRAGNMKRWLSEVLEGEFGGVDKYLTEMCGLSSDDVRKIQRNLVVEGEGRGPVPIHGWDDRQEQKNPIEANEGGGLGLAKDDGVGRGREEKVMVG